MIFIDTNVLIYSISKENENYKQAEAIISQINGGILTACISTQILAEFYSVITGTRWLSKPLSPNDAVDLVTMLGDSNITTLCPQHSTLNMALSLAKRESIRRIQFFDTLIVATMIENGVNTIYTSNAEHFKMYSEITVINPFVTAS